MLTKVNSLQYVLEKYIREGNSYKLIPYNTEIYIDLRSISSITVYPTNEKWQTTDTITVRMVNGYSFVIDDQEMERMVKMTTRTELHKAIKIVLDVIEASGSLLDYIDLDDTDVSWDMFEDAIETLQSVVNEE